MAIFGREWTRMQMTSIAGYAYAVNGDHRNGSAIKSQWAIAVADEFMTFERSIVDSWIKHTAAWGLHLSSDVAVALGTSAAGKGKVYPLYVAYFQLADVCHGYPSDPQRSTREIPPADILKTWLSSGYFRPAVIRKMGRGQRCKV